MDWGLEVNGIIESIYSTVIQLISINTILKYSPEVLLIAAIVGVISIFMLVDRSNSNGTVTALLLRHYISAADLAYILFDLFVSPATTNGVYMVLASTVILMLILDVFVSPPVAVLDLISLVAFVGWANTYHLGAMLDTEMGIKVGIILTLAVFILGGLVNWFIQKSSKQN